MARKITAKTAMKRATKPSIEERAASNNQPYMDEAMLADFRTILVGMREQEIRALNETKVEATQNIGGLENFGSASRRAHAITATSMNSLRSRTLAAINIAIGKIDNDGDYGYCEETGEPIGIDRMRANPTATLSIEAQEKLDRRQKLHRADGLHA